MATDGDSTDPRAGLKAGVLTRLLAEVAAPADMDPAGATLIPGAEVGRFVLEREIGRGGFGRVFEARDRELNRHVALKVLRPRPEALGAEGDLLRQEGEAAAQLTHENVVTVHELGRCEWGVYLVLELLEGETLAERLSRGPLPVDEAVRIAAGVASALAHAHARGVLHRDLKPSNVFLCKDGAPKVLDFGLARVFGGPSPAGGTPQYMAPEQWFDHPQDERTDLFSLGVLLFEALAGQRPFTTRDGLSSSLDPLPAPELPASAGPRALRRLVARCLEKLPGERPAGAPEVLAALERLMPERRARRRLLLGAAAFGALLLAVAGAGWWRRGAGDARGRTAVVVADFEDSTGDETLYGLPALLGAALQQSERIEVVPHARLHDLLREAGREGVEHVGEEEAREAGLLAGARVLLVAALRREGEAYRLELRGTEVVGGAKLLAVSGRSTDRGGIPDLLDRAARDVRLALGEGRAEVERSAIPLVQAATADVEAWKRYYEGLECLARRNNAGDFAACLPAFEEATRRDPGFAIAHLQRSYIHHWDGDTQARKRAALEPALRGVERLPLRDQLRVRGWAAFLDGRAPEAKGLLRQAAEASPDDKNLWYLAAEVPFHRDELAEAVPLLLRAQRLDPTWILVNQHLALALGSLGRLDELRALVGRLEALGARPEALASLCWARLWLDAQRALVDCRAAVGGGKVAQAEEFMAFALLHAGDRPGLERFLDGVAARRLGGGAAWDTWMRVYLRGQEGRWREVRKALAAHPTEDLWVVAAYAEMLLGAGDTAAAWSYARRARDIDVRGASYLAVHFAHAGDLAHAEELAVGLPQNSPREAAYRAVVRWRGGDVAGALEALRAVDAQGPMSADPASSHPAFLLGEALLEAGRDGEAAAVLRRFIDTPLTYPAWSHARALLLLARAQERMGDLEAARRAGTRLLALWSRADPEQPFLGDAQALWNRLGLSPR